MSAAQRVATPERGLSSRTRRDYRVRQGAGHPRGAVRVQPLQLPAVPEARARGGRAAVRGGGGAAVRSGVGQHAGGACGVAPQPHGTGVLQLSVTHGDGKQLLHILPQVGSRLYKDQEPVLILDFMR